MNELTERSHEPRLAILIDADNTSAKFADAIFKEVATLGEASVRRIYGDFSGTRLAAWKEKLSHFAVIPHQQFAYTTGKNSSDIALVIDAMDLLHTGRFDGFVLVSSDSDFTRLAGRIREQGLQVFGVGKIGTPDAFRRACKRFIFIENLLDGAELGLQGDPSETKATDANTLKPNEAATRPRLEVKEATPEPSQAVEDSPIKQPPSKAIPLIAAAIRNHEEDWVPLSVIGSHIHEANADFDPRTYGCAKLADLLEKTGQFQVNRNTPVRARMKRLL
ncbi:MAG: NYN domain-containing protein [Gammaproteobacteria bacterium]|nr:NYN domain-containing protein [Gammaproteobacteria bacterium]